MTQANPTRPQIVHRDRIQSRTQDHRERAVPLSLLDATTANFGLTSAIWLIERPTHSLDSADLADHLKAALSTTLDAYRQWCGFLKAILNVDGVDLPLETASFPPHAKRYGRVYVHYGTSADPGIEFVEATSTATVDALYDAASAQRRPVWNRRESTVGLSQFVPPTEIVNAFTPNERDTHGLYKPMMAVQYTRLACGGLVLAAKIAHPLADITALTRFVQDWASVSSAMISEKPLPVLSPEFDPSRLDACAAGDINAQEADPPIVEDALGLPMHRYDWWAAPGEAPTPFPKDLPPAGKPMPWIEWDTKAPVDQYTIHFSREQIDHLWQAAVKTRSQGTSDLRITKHDALLAHVWSCVVRARGLEGVSGSVHCDLVLGTRPAFELDGSFVGSPITMLNIEMPASQVYSSQALGSIADRIRGTVSTAKDPQRLAAHLHSIAYERSPQRIWQAFLGRRHILVTTWARAGIYEVDFGFGSRIRYADGVVPCLDGCVLIADGPPVEPVSAASTGQRGWTENGVDVTLPLRCEDMERLLQDPMLLPRL